MHQKRRGRRRKRFQYIITTCFFLVLVTVILCGLPKPSASVNHETSDSSDHTYETATTVAVQAKYTPERTQEIREMAYERQVVSKTESQPVPQSIESEQPEEDPFRYYDCISLEYELQELVWNACEETGCPYELALSVIFCESAYLNVNGDSGNSIGYMQIQPRWHYDRMERLGVTDLSDPLSNFRVGCDLLAELIEKYVSVEAALTCYNTGSPGTSKYANKVLSYMNETFFVCGDGVERE